MQVFPDVEPEQKSGADYFRDALDLAEESNKLGLTHICIVENYFCCYGGYSPQPDAVPRRRRPAHTPRAAGDGALLPVFVFSEMLENGHVSVTAASRRPNSLMPVMDSVVATTTSLRASA